MTDGVLFSFPGICLTHRQLHDMSDKSNDSLFFNLGSYCRKRLFSYIKRSFNRKKCH